MQIAPPFGYKAIVPFNRAHRIRLLAPGEIPEFARALNAVPISYTEFAPVAGEYPIAFTAPGDAGTYSAVAALGMRDGENLYNQGDRWARGVYVPAYVRRFPFCMSRVTIDQVEQKSRLICVEKSHVDEQAGEALFGAGGEPSEKWRTIEKLLSEYETDLGRSQEMCGILADYGLFEPFTMQARMNSGGESMTMSGMFRVAEAKIEHLNASQLRNLVRKGILSRVYAHLLSLNNFARLLDRRAARAA